MTATPHSYVTLGYGFQVAGDGELAALVDLLLADFRVDRLDDAAPVYEVRTTGSERAPLVLTRNGELAQISTAVLPLAYFVLWEAYREGIHRTTDRILVHAAGVSLDRVGLLLPAPPDGGKSTLTIGLVRAGFAYRSDEIMPVDPDTGELGAFARPLWVEETAAEVFPDLPAALPAPFDRPTRGFFQVPVRALDARVESALCPLTLVVSPRYVPHAVTTLEPMSRAETLSLLMEQLLNPEHVGTRALHRFARLLSDVPGYRLISSSLDEAVEAVTGLVREVAVTPS